MNEQPGSPGANELPPEVIRSIGTYLRLWDLLTARRTCTQWADALAPSVTQLRVHLRSNPDPTPSHKLQDTQVAGYGLTDAAQQLSDALGRFPRVHSVTLLLSPDTSSQDLQQALRVVGCKPGITTVYICEVPSTLRPSSADRARRYGSGLELRHLRHVTDLQLHTQALTLAEIWQQLATLNDAPYSRSNSDADAAAGMAGCGISNSTCINNSSSGSSRGAVDGQQPSANNSSYALRSLTVHQHPGASANEVVCDLQQLQLPQHLAQLVTPLPGQYNTAGGVACPLNTSHQSFVQKLAAGLPFLKCLHITDVYEGNEGVFEGFKELTELHVELGGAFRSMALDIHDNQEQTEGRFFVTQVGQLQRLELEHPALSLAARMFVHSMQLRVTQGMHTPVKLEWLRENRQLQHLSAALIQTGEDLTGLNGQLKSLSGCCSPPSEELLRQIYSVGSALTSLKLYDSTPDFRSTIIPPRVTHRAAQPGIPVPLPAATFSGLVSLALMGREGRMYTVKDPQALWQQLPALRSLKLQHVQLGPQKSHRVILAGASDATAVEATLEGRRRPHDPIPNHAFLAWGEIPQLWIHDLPCHQLEQLELAQYKLVVERSSACCSAAGQLEQQNHGGRPQPPPPRQQQQQPGCSGCTAQPSCGTSSCVQAAQPEGIAGDLRQLDLEAAQPGQACAAAQMTPIGLQDARNSGGSPASEHPAGCGTSCAAHSSGGCSFHGLRHLTLVDCTCWVAEPTNQNADMAEYTVAIGCPSVVLTLLLGPSGAASNLKRLELWDMRLGKPDLQFVLCSQLAIQLEQLVVTQHWGLLDWTSDGCSAGSAVAQQELELQETVAAAAKAGMLQRLKTLCVMIPDPECADGDMHYLKHGQQGHYAFLGHTEQGPLSGGHCHCFRHLRQLRF